MELGVLGPLQVRQYGLPVAIPGAKPRSILVMLGLHFAHGPTTDRPDAIVGARLTSRLAVHPHLLSLASRLGSPTAVIVGSVLSLMKMVS